MAAHSPPNSISRRWARGTTHILAAGLTGPLNEAFRTATANMAQRLTDANKLTPSEAAQGLHTAAEFKVSEVADGSAGKVLRICEWTSPLPT